MASNNVFGTPVTVGSRVERAQNALNNPNEGGKREEALAYIRNEKANWGTGVSTLCIFYNATGESLLYAQEDSSYGNINGTYPLRVQNGQWGAFLHVKKPVVASGSVGLVVYRGRSNDTDFVKQVISWQTPWGQLQYNNQAYCDVFDDTANISPQDIYDKKDAADTRVYSVLKSGMFLTATIETGTSPLFEAQFTIADAARILSSKEVGDLAKKTSSEEVGDIAEKTSFEEVKAIN